MKIREAVYNDLDNVFKLSNDDEVRKYSYNVNKIKYEDHIKWFKEKINDEKCLFLIIEDEDNFIGQVRFDIEKNEAIINISISKNYRSKGLSKDIMFMSIDYLNNKKTFVKKIKAYIKETNVISRKYFEKCNYSFNKIVLINNQKSFEYYYEI